MVHVPPLPSSSLNVHKWMYIMVGNMIALPLGTFQSDMTRSLSATPTQKITYLCLMCACQWHVTTSWREKSQNPKKSKWWVYNFYNYDSYPRCESCIMGALLLDGYTKHRCRSPETGWSAVWPRWAIEPIKRCRAANRATNCSLQREPEE